MDKLQILTVPSGVWATDGVHELMDAVVSQAIIKARNDALEECAKIADGWQESHDFDASTGIAQAIRNLKHEGER